MSEAALVGRVVVASGLAAAALPPAALLLPNTPNTSALLLPHSVRLTLHKLIVLYPSLPNPNLPPPSISPYTQPHHNLLHQTKALCITPQICLLLMSRNVLATFYRYEVVMIYFHT